MARPDYDFEERRSGITRYVIWTLAACLALGGFLYADGYFETVTEQTTEAPREGSGAG